LSFPKSDRVAMAVKAQRKKRRFKDYS
jgi:hypothetical protein